MNARRFISAVVILFLAWCWQTSAQGQPEGNPAEVFPETMNEDVLTRGPVHEAFAEPGQPADAAPVVIPRRPPELIEEVPPDVKPDDDNSIWISGYWSWDDDRQDFIWVSGVWRVPPPGQLWVAGYWTEVSGGYRWVPGFWTPVEQQNVEYYPTPPESLERGPTSASPGENYLWTPGCWLWRDTRFAWRPGYWILARPNWVWINDSYCWSPRGWVFRAGYWDYPLLDRGLMFAPVYFSRPPRHVYRPSIAIDTSLLTFSLFVRPNYRHYYFGDYYAAAYDRRGIYPWFSMGQYKSYRYDPLFAYYDWRNRGRDPQWSRNLRGWYDYYRQHPDQRPPHDFSQQQRIVAKSQNRPDERFLALAKPVDKWRNDPKAPVRIAPVQPERRTQFDETAKLMRQFQTERARLETGAIAGRGRSPIPATSTIKQPEKVALPKSAASLVRTIPQVQPREGRVPPRPDGGGARTLMKPVVPDDDRGAVRQRSDDMGRSVIPPERKATPALPPTTSEPRLPPREQIPRDAQRIVPPAKQEQPRRPQREQQIVPPSTGQRERTVPQPKSIAPQERRTPPREQITPPASKSTGPPAQQLKKTPSKEPGPPAGGRNIAPPSRSGGDRTRDSAGPKKDGDDKPKK